MYSGTWCWCWAFGQLALRRLLSAPDHASANQLPGPRQPAIQASFPTEGAAAYEERGIEAGACGELGREESHVQRAGAEDDHPRREHGRQHHAAERDHQVPGRGTGAHE